MSVSVGITSTITNASAQSSTTESWKPPSEAIQRLFEMRESRDDLENQIQLGGETISGGLTEEEITKLPSTLAKAIRRINCIQQDVERQKKQISDTHIEIKALNTLLVRYSKKYVKQVEKDAIHSKKHPRGFACPSKTTDALCDFMGKPRGSKISRTDTSAFLSKYIEEHGLQDPAKKSVIIPDKALIDLFGLAAIQSEELNYFSMQKHLTQHFLK
jgi:chromatin remodeling complex protein RSC6